jgi:Rrf2 family protein
MGCAIRPGPAPMKLKISSQLAIFALLELGRKPDRQLSVGEIGEKYGVSSHHLAKVMNVLGRAGYVRAARGAGGGYQLSGNLRRATLLDVIELFEHAGSASLDAGESTAEGRALRQVLQEVGAIARATLGSITLATMLKLVEREAGQHPSARAGLPR